MSPTKINILKFLNDNPQTSVVKLVDHFSISKQAMHKHLRELIELKQIEKKGLPPRVYYSAILQHQLNNTFDNFNLDSDFELNNFIIITPSGEKYTGIKAFKSWCKERGFSIDKYYQIYQEIHQKYQQYYDLNGLINATEKVKNTFGTDCFIDQCYYNSFSAIEIFERTGIYSQMLYAKQSGNKKNMLELFPEFAQKVYFLIKTNNIQAIGFIPPTVPRKIQLMKEIEKYLNLSLPKVTIQKITNQYIVPQKTLSKPSERKQNANSTFAVEYVPEVKNILLIDDFVGSGSSFNFVAKKIKSKQNCNITCLAISGTPNGIINNQNNKFEVINEA